MNPSVGLSEIAGIGEEVAPDLPLALIHAPSEAAADAVEAAVRAAFAVGPDEVDDPPLIIARVG